MLRKLSAACMMLLVGCALLPIEPHTSIDFKLKQSYCPSDMVEVEGDYCPRVSEICLRWLDADQRPTANKGEGPLRCAEFKAPTTCLSASRVHMHFCMSKFEYPGTDGSYPIVDIDYATAKSIAEKDGRRLCTKNEFNFACEGESMHPYGYGDGFHRDAKICNIDKPWHDFRKYKESQYNDHSAGLYQGLLSDDKSMCKSWVGAYNLNGNVDEILDSEHSKNVILSGGHWAGVRSRCRPLTNSHGKDFKFYQTGFRECKDI